MLLDLCYYIERKSAVVANIIFEILDEGFYNYV
jgi:hypothetical protein